MVANKLSILIVDDSAFIRIGLRHYLENHGFIIHEACDTIEATFLFEQHKIDIAILDISLQIGPDGKEGLNLAREIKTKMPEVGIILFSGSPSHYQEFLEISRKYRGIAYLYKGSNYKDELLSAIEQVGKGGVWASPEIASYKACSVSLPLSKAEQEAIQNALRHFGELSDKELDIVQLIAMSCDNKEIAKQKNITLNTVSAHMTHIYSKLGLEEKWSNADKRSLLTKAYWMSKKTNRMMGSQF